MKNIILIILSALLVINLSAQEVRKDNYPKILDKLVLDFGAMPMSIQLIGEHKLNSYSISLGYQITDNFDLRINNDMFNVIGPSITDGFKVISYEKVLAFSLGANYRVLRGKGDSFMKNTSLALVGKLGFGLNREYMEQNAFFYDFSVRGYLGKIPYVGIGINQIYFDVLDDSLLSLYFTFGIDI